MSESKKLFAILHVKKLFKHSLYSVHKHNYREMDVPNAQEGIENTHWTSDGSDKTIPQLVRARLKEYPDLRIQKNSVLAMEILLTASPEFYEENTDDKIDEWEKASKQWLMKEFGDNVVQISTHYDEKSPHMHCIIVPIVMKTKQKRQTKAQKKANEQGDTYESMSLCANHIFTKESLTRMQTEYAISVKKFGLKRGVKGSKDTHVPMKVLRAKTDELKLKTDNVIEQKNELKKYVVVLKKRSKNENEKLTIRKRKLEAKVEVESAKIIKATENNCIALKEIKNENEKLTNRERKLKAKVEVERAKIIVANENNSVALKEIKNEKVNLLIEQQNLQKEKEDTHAEIKKAEDKRDSIKQETNIIIDECFYPFLNHFENLLSNLTPEAINFYKERYREFDDNMVKFNDKIPEKLPSKIRSEIKNVLSM